MNNAENFTPIRNIEPKTIKDKIITTLRHLIDFQVITVYRELKRIKFRGKVIDIGCGNKPYKHLIENSGAEYYGLDIDKASEYNYFTNDIVVFDGNDIPFRNESFDFIICTEVLEHIVYPRIIINEMWRILKRNGYVIITIPWSARYHYIPNDYHRYSPSMIHELFGNYFIEEIMPRGSDITVVMSKLIIIFINATKTILSANCNSVQYVFYLLMFAILFPILPLVVLLGHLSLHINIGSCDDPLGYTVIGKKR